MGSVSGAALGVDRLRGVVGAQSRPTLRPCRPWNRPSPLTRHPGKTESRFSFHTCVNENSLIIIHMVALPPIAFSG